MHQNGFSIASTCRLLVGGGLLESTIRDFHFSAVMQVPWAQIALLPCDQQRKHPKLRKMGWCSSWSRRRRGRAGYAIEEMSHR